MTQKDLLEKAISVVGTQAAFARAIKATDSKLWNWMHRGDRVPAEFCPEIEKVTGIRCEELRPDVDWGFLRKGTLPKRKPKVQSH